VITVLRLAGVSLLVLALLHAALWRTFRWGSEITRLSPINARVFVVHLIFIAFVLAALGLLSLLRPDLLLAKSDLARLLLYGIVAFWVVRLLFQPLVFDGALKEGWTSHPIVRIGANLLWAAYVAVYGAALLGQVGSL
jgi:phosphoglycerol transferase MdoB-like AlkP superfamily enzyme